MSSHLTAESIRSVKWDGFSENNQKDRGRHCCSSAHGCQRWGRGEEPRSNLVTPDLHHLYFITAEASCKTTAAVLRGIFAPLIVSSHSPTMAGDKKPSSPQSDASSSSATAKDRLAQVSSHIAPNTPRKRRRKHAEPELPADYSDILGQIVTLRKIAATPDANNRGYVRQKQAGKLWVRERVEQLLDTGSFQEVGSVSGTVNWKQLGFVKEEPVDYIPSNNVQGAFIPGLTNNVNSYDLGFGRLRGRKIVFTADDFSIRAGHADGALMDKTVCGACQWRFRLADNRRSIWRNSRYL